MKKILLFTALIANILCINAQNMTCRYGFSYEISNNDQWGKDKPIIMRVYPNSPAEKAGLQQYDIVEQVNGISMRDASFDDMDSLLTSIGKEPLDLVVRNYRSSGKELRIVKDCKRNTMLNEDQLATSFAMYSLESTQERLFICPFKTTTTTDNIDFSQFKTFDFATPESSLAKEESVINATIKTELQKKGLQQNSLQPDFIIHTYYTFNKNPNFKVKSKATQNQAPVYRYDVTRDKVVKFPFYDLTTPESEAEYILQLGVRFVDQSAIPGRVLWECEANELLKSPYSVADYASINIPFMCMQFPYVKYQRNAQFKLTKKSYNYTGINFDINQLNLVADVDDSSPAGEMGILPGDVIEKIENKTMNHTANEFSAVYRQFITNTTKFRDKSTRFTDANGFPDCMYWDSFKYPQIAKAFNNDKYLTGFSYLYYFAPYVNPSGNSSCTFIVKRDKEKLTFVVRPIFRSEKTIELN